MRTGVTLSDITRAADQLLANGERPTVEGIRNFLGTGSPANVNSLLKEYYQALPARLNLPAPIATAAAELYEKVRSTAMEEVEGQRVELERQATLDREQLAQERRAFDSEKTTLRSQVASLTNDVQRQQEVARQQANRIAALEKDLAAQSQRAAGAEALVKASEEERDRASSRHSAELQRLREQAEGNERHFLARIEEHKTQQQRFQADREREAAAATKRIAGLELSLSEALKLQASLRGEVTATQRDLAKAHDAKQASEQGLERAQSELLRAESQSRQAIEKALTESEQSRLASEGYRRERDDALRELARSEGKVGAINSQLEEARAEIARLHRVGALVPHVN